MRLPPPPEQKPISSGSRERWEPTGWVIGQENKFSVPGDIFLHRFLSCGGGLGFFLLQEDGKVVPLMFSPVSDTEM